VSFHKYLLTVPFKKKLSHFNVLSTSVVLFSFLQVIGMFRNDVIVVEKNLKMGSILCAVIIISL
jgi:hypothetical protein